MANIHIQLTGVAAELTLGNYMPTDPTIMNNWEDFYHYNDLIHCSQLLTDHISEIQIKENNKVIFTGQVPEKQFQEDKSIAPILSNRALYLRTECVEQAVYTCSFEAENFDKTKLIFETQDYDLLFKVGKSFVSKVIYDDTEINLEWVSGKPVGNICLLCMFENGYLIPVYDAINKIESK
jgi:hypothetical protein